MARSDDRIGVLFVCLGNICRSPLAEGIFLHKLKQRGIEHRFRVDSAGTGDWHAGELPDPRTLAIAAKYGIVLPSRARQVTRDDFDVFHHLVCMDENNRRTLQHRGAPATKLRLMLAADPKAKLREVPDPYYGGEDGFEYVYRLLDSAGDALLQQLVDGKR
jgi:protein-tyrosine phosphatase